MAARERLNETNVESYGAVKREMKNRDFNNWDVSIFTMIFWNVYVSRKMLYPFTKEFAAFYGFKITTFSFILSAFDIGGTASIFMALVPSMHHIRIDLIMFLFIFTLAALYFILSFCYIFIGLFLIRFAMGFISNTLVAEIRGIVSIFTKESDHESTDGNKLTFRILLTENSWFTSSIAWIIVGVILHRLNVIYVWYFACICAVFVSCLCYFLPSFTVSDILSMKSKSTDNLNITGLFKQYHLYFLYFGSVFFSFGYASFLSTFGPFMQETFHLDAEQMGYQTLFISFAEFIAIITASYASKYKSNIFWVIFSAFMVVLIALIFVIGLRINIVNEIFIWIILFIYPMFIEFTFLNFK